MLADRSTGALRASRGGMGAALGLSLGLSLGALLASPATARAWCQMTTSDLSPTAAEPCILASNHPGEFPLAWRRPCTSIALSTSDASEDVGMDEVRAILSRSIASWESVTCDGTPTDIDIELLTETTIVDRARHFAGGRNVNAVIFVHEGWVSERDHHPLALAVTYVWHDPTTGEIFDGDLELNEDNNAFVVCPETGCSGTPTDTADLENTITHELGHYLGVAHTPDDRDATMWAMASPGETLKRSLAPDDRAALCGIYPPGSLPDACDYTPRGGLGLDGAPPSGCGACGAGLGPDRRSASALGVLGAVLAMAVARSRRRRR